MAEETLLRHSVPFVFPWDPSIAFSPGDGRAGRRPSPRISAPGAEGGGDGQRMTVQNLGEDSSPWFCFVPYLVGLSIAQLSARASPRPVGWAPVLRKVLAGHEWPDPPNGTPTSFSPRLRKVETIKKGLWTPVGVGKSTPIADEARERGPKGGALLAFGKRPAPHHRGIRRSRSEKRAE